MNLKRLISLLIAFALLFNNTNANSIHSNDDEVNTYSTLFPIDVDWEALFVGSGQSDDISIEKNEKLSDALAVKEIGNSKNINQECQNLRLIISKMLHQESFNEFDQIFEDKTAMTKMIQYSDLFKSIAAKYLKMFRENDINCISSDINKVIDQLKSYLDVERELLCKELAKGKAKAPSECITDIESVEKAMLLFSDKATMNSEDLYAYYSAIKNAVCYLFVIKVCSVYIEENFTNEQYNENVDIARNLRFQLLIRSLLDADAENKEGKINFIENKEQVNFMDPQISMTQDDSIEGKKAVICVSDNLTDKTVRSRLKNKFAKLVTADYANYEIYFDNGFTDKGGIERSIPTIETAASKLIAQDVVSDMIKVRKDININVYFVGESHTDVLGSKEKSFSMYKIYNDNVFKISKGQIEPKTCDTKVEKSDLDFPEAKLSQIDITKQLLKILYKQANINLPLITSRLNEKIENIKTRIDKEFSMCFNVVKGAQFEIDIRKYFDNNDGNIGNVNFKEITSGKTYKDGTCMQYELPSRECTVPDLEAYKDQEIVDIECKACKPSDSLVQKLKYELAGRERHAKKICCHCIIIDNRTNEWDISEFTKEENDKLLKARNKAKEKHTSESKKNKILAKQLENIKIKKEVCKKYIKQIFELCKSELQETISKRKGAKKPDRIKKEISIFFFQKDHKLVEIKSDGEKFILKEVNAKSDKIVLPSILAA